MEGVLLSALGGHGKRRRASRARPRMDLNDLDNRTLWLQVNSIEKSTIKGYTTGGHDYLNFCLTHSLPIDPTPKMLARYNCVWPKVPNWCPPFPRYPLSQF